MIDDEKKMFESFQAVHDKYSLDQDKWQNEFNRVGAKILEITREYENRLCANQERGMYNRYSAGLAEKFQNEIRKKFPMYDHIGIKVKNSKQKSSKPNSGANSEFTLKKINLA